MAKKPLTDKEGEVRELTRDDMRSARPFKDAFPEEHQNWKRGRGRPKAETTKERITIRLDADIVQWFREKEKGAYQSQMNRALREWIEEHR